MRQIRKRWLSSPVALVVLLAATMVAGPLVSINIGANDVFVLQSTCLGDVTYMQKGFIGIRLFADGKWAEDWHNHDTLGMMRQPGVVPANGEQQPDHTRSSATPSCQRTRG